MPSPVSISFLGGLGEIGRNCAVIEFDKKMLMVDCGLMFPDSSMPGIDLVLPDFTFVRERKKDLVGVVVTHGHEDHIGALSFLLRDVPTTIYGSEMTLGLAQGRIEENGLSESAKLVSVKDGDKIDIGPFNVEFIPVTHSVPHAFALAIKTPQGLIIHTGDFKLDPDPIDGRTTNLARIAELAKTEKVRLLLADSTNAEEPGSAESESAVGDVLKKIFSKHKEERLIVGCFASHIHRVQQVIWAAEENGRKVATLGRTMGRNVGLARDMKILSVKNDTLINIEDIKDYADEELCILSTGSQGEPLSALALMSAGENKWLKVTNNDMVIMSSHVIPGNEANVYAVIDGLYRIGADVIYSDIAPVHTTGHAKRDELCTMIKTADPECFIPVHGEYRHLIQHQKLAIDCGVDPGRTIVAEDGDVIELNDHDIEFAGDIPAGFVFVDGLSDDLDDIVLRDRRVLSNDGVVIVVATIDHQTGELAGRPEVITRGWTDGDEGEELLAGARDAVKTKLAKTLHAHPEMDSIKQDMRRAVGKYVNEHTGRRPMIVPIVMET